MLWFDCMIYIFVVSQLENGSASKRRLDSKSEIMAAPANRVDRYVDVESM